MLGYSVTKTVDIASRL